MTGSKDLGEIEHAVQCTVPTKPGFISYTRLKIPLPLSQQIAHPETH